MLSHHSLQTPTKMAYGGTVTKYTYGGINWVCHTFRSSGKFIVYHNKGNLTCDILVIGGGGSGGAHSGGGGAGELVWTTGTSVTPGAKTITIGIGGGTNLTRHISSNNYMVANYLTYDGGVSYFDQGGAQEIDANFGGGGGIHSGGANKRGRTGGSSGGHSRDGNDTTPMPVTKLSSGLGNVGGDTGGSSYASGGGGGGAGEPGYDGSRTNGNGSIFDHIGGGSGGCGASAFLPTAGSANPVETLAFMNACNIGVDGFIAAGGGGGAYRKNGGAGGKGGGGTGFGSSTSNIPDRHGWPNTGSGGGGNGYNVSGTSMGHAGDGGSGLVVVRYQQP